MNDIYGYQPNDTKWCKLRLNRKFMNNLTNEFGQKEFTLKQAYLVYAQHAKENFWRHYASVQERAEDMWMQMNARNHISAAAHRGILIRVKRGTYKFNK